MTANYLKSIIIKLLGGVTCSEHDLLNSKLEHLEKEREQQKGVEVELNIYKDFVKSISSYAGSYPTLKVQSEYRNMLHEIGYTLPGNHDDALGKTEQIDFFLGNVTHSLARLINKIDEINGTMDGSELYIHGWSKEHLLNEANSKYPLDAYLCKLDYEQTAFKTKNAWKDMTAAEQLAIKNADNKELSDKHLALKDKYEALEKEKREIKRKFHEIYQFYLYNPVVNCGTLDCEQ